MRLVHKGFWDATRRTIEWRYRAESEAGDWAGPWRASEEEALRDHPEDPHAERLAAWDESWGDH